MPKHDHIRTTLEALTDEELLQRCVEDIRRSRECRDLTNDEMRDLAWGECLRRGRSTIWDSALRLYVAERQKKRQEDDAALERLLSRHKGEGT